MSAVRAHLRRRLLGISTAETSFARRGFRSGDAAARQTLEQVGIVFLAGYHEALETTDPDSLAERLNTIDARVRGFAFEGAAMALSILDRIVPGGRRWLAFTNGAGSRHVYMLHVGFGWTIARLPWLRYRVEGCIAQLDPLMRWLALDGYGFHEGYFHWPQSVTRQAVPRRLHGYARRAFDQGLGRSLWFVEGADAGRIARTIANFPAARHGDLWSGVGLACAYAGGVQREAIENLSATAIEWRAHLGQGASFAAVARQRAGNPAEHTDRACRVLCGISADAAATMADAALTDARPDGSEPAYEVGRRHIREHLAQMAECDGRRYSTTW